MGKQAGVWSLDGTRSVVMENEVELLQMPSEKENGATVANGSSKVVDEEEVGRDTDRLFSSVSCENRLQLTLALAESCGMGLANRLLDAGAGKILEEAKIETAKQQ